MHVKDHLSSQLQRAVDLNSEPGASSWLLALPLQEQGFHLNKQEFWDAVHLRYGWKLLNVPSHCVCGASFIIDHAMVCQHGGLTFVRHNDFRDITAGCSNNASPQKWAILLALGTFSCPLSVVQHTCSLVLGW